MATNHSIIEPNTAKVRNSCLIELPEAARELGLQPGEEVDVSLERNGSQSGKVFPPDERGLQAMREIAERQKRRPFSDDGVSMKLLREARSGAMSGYEASDE